MKKIKATLLLPERYEKVKGLSKTIDTYPRHFELKPCYKEVTDKNGIIKKEYIPYEETGLYKKSQFKF